MDGIINVLKPPGMTSHDVVSFLRKTFQTRKVGHTGTLDPGVPGVLAVCIGKATRVAEFLTEGTKSYRGIIKFGVTTTTQDGFGEITEVKDASYLKQSDIADCFKKFIGVIEQVPPMVSAVKIGGRKLYELARQGKEIVRPPRTVVIHSLIIKRFTNLGSAHPEVMFDVTCSKGTYVRTLCHDIGQALGCGAYMSYLIRTSSGPFKLMDAYTLEEIDELARKQEVLKALQPIDSALIGFPVILVRESAVKAVINGNKIYPSGLVTEPGEIAQGCLVRLQDKNGSLLAVAEARVEKLGDRKRRVFQPIKVFG
ncbi:tRNA pseudouridine(55) synthase TruB [Thermincola potens]|uniref:tRNA pseudouridine synthase B n=1 Tax=Thermincola potens (strain JR) TaxID=635013 RepID=D5XF16_THEPJ|nr:tRNA pseudouridine(55) synthase TruB [Thermincola potens]ADG82237.1 tRNA pseudouridine synthase B [Thermincola potens JR]